MSIEQTDVVDFIGTDKATGLVILTISDHLDWSDEHEHWHCLFRGSLRDACVKYGLELEAALKELKYGSSLRGPGDVVLRKAYKT